MRLGLGTVQFGLNYGISNPEGKTPFDNVKTILKFAEENDIRVLDTASSYGESEAVLGKVLTEHCQFSIYTKTPVYKKNKINYEDAENLKKAFYNSLGKLNQSNIEGIFAHHADDLLAEGGEELFYAMQDIKGKGLVRKIGVSVYTGEQIDLLLERYDFDVIQLPINVLDQRLIQSGHLKRLKQQGIELHARSIFLQGLILLDTSQLPPFFAPVKDFLCNYRSFLQTKGLSPIEGAFCFIKQVPEIDVVIIGVNNLEQLNNNVKSFYKSYDFLLEDFEKYSLTDTRYLNPALWNIN